MTATDTSTSQAVGSAHNRLSGYSYDANGNQTSSLIAGQSGAVGLSYDIENRLIEVGGGGGSVYGQYAYNHLNQRVWRLGTESGTPNEEIYFYGVDGQRLASYTLAAGLPTQGDGNIATLAATASDVQIYFGHKLVQRGAYSSTAQGSMPAVFIGQDMVGSVRTDGSGNWPNFYPWGAEQGTVTPNDRVKFATYTRDGETGLDYAMNRYYNSGTGRFLTPDPFNGSGNPSNPVSWNPYAYMNDSPVNGNDPRGLIAGIPGGPGGPGFGDPNDMGCEDLSTWMENFFDFGVNPMGGLYGDLNCSLLSFYMPYTPSVQTGGGGRWSGLSDSCKNGLRTALPGSSTSAMLQALNNATAVESTLKAATAGTSIDWAMLAAIGIRESGFTNVSEADGAGVGVGVFQITVSPSSGVTTAQASNLTWSAKYAANLLNSNLTTLALDFPTFTATQLMQATAASYNFGTSNISGNPNTIDAGTTHNNYGSNILQLMNCF